MKKSFCLILNCIEVEADSFPVQITPEHFLQKANPEQVEHIKRQIQVFDPMAISISAYEGIFVQEEDGWKNQQLPPEKWRYWIIACEDPNKFKDFEYAAGLLRAELDLGFRWYCSPCSSNTLAVTNFRVIHRFMNNAYVFPANPPVCIGAKEFQEIRDNYALVVRARVEFPQIFKAIARFDGLKELLHDSEFLAIGYFSVIESLITHAPELTEPMDSLTHQMRTKMNLLSKRFQRPINYEHFFGITDGDKVWSKLYAYRSKLAHGDDADFKHELKMLRSSANALQFLKEAAKLVILSALKEPELMIDLKKC